MGLHTIPDAGQALPTLRHRFFARPAAGAVSKAVAVCWRQRPLAPRSAARCLAVRLAQAGDLNHLCELEVLTADHRPWSRSQIEEELCKERSRVLVVDEGAGPIAWAVIWLVPFEVHLLNIAVHPRHRRRGLARVLLSTLLEQHSHGAELVMLEVRASNQPARKLYEDVGFQPVGQRRGYYSDGEDAVLMSYSLV